MSRIMQDNYYLSTCEKRLNVLLSSNTNISIHWIFVYFDDTLQKGAATDGPKYSNHFTTKVNMNVLI